MDVAQIPVEAIRNSIRSKADSIDFTRMARKGANGYVFFGKHRILDQERAVKYYYWGGTDKYHAEPRHLAAITSPYVAEIFHAEMVDDEWALFETPYYANGDIQDLLDSMHISLSSALDLTEDLVRGINDLHAANLIHRDLKPDNIFLSGESRAIIGDFGSVKKLPDAAETIPGSGHSLIFRPPESAEHNIYGRSGDIYQAGLLCYQLLGGSIPYDEVSWLTKRELKTYREITDSVEQRIFADTIFKRRIVGGRIVKVSSLHPWVPDPLRRFIRKATHENTVARFENSTTVLAALHKVRSRVPNWEKDGQGFLMVSGNNRRRVMPVDTNTWRVERPRGAGWQRDGSYDQGERNSLIQALNNRFVS